MNNNNNELLEFDYSATNSSIIKVIGVGGGGGNAVQHMYREGIHDVSFVLCNTDNQALMKSDIPTKLQIGKMITKGLGAGNKPWKAKQAAEESAEDIKSLLDDGITEMVFITAGMGGGTGTGAAPVIAKIAKDMGILTVGIVTIPFVFEGKNKILQALNGVEEMSKNVDALLVINNERLIDIYQKLTVREGFAKADNTLTIAAKSIAETITLPGDINLDFADVKSTLKDGGVAIMSTGMASGSGRLAKAFENALHSPLVNNNDAFDAKKILFNISSSESVPLIMEEMLEINDFMAKFESKDIEVIWGTATDNELGENVKITVLATGFGVESIPMMDENTKLKREELARAEEDELRKNKELMIKYHYDPDKIGVKIRPKPYIFSLEDLDNDSLIDIVLNNPAYNRSLDVFSKNAKRLESVAIDEQDTQKNIITF